MTQKEFLHKLKEHFNHTAVSSDISQLVLFGSQAKNTATSHSDYDVLIVIKNKDYDWKYNRNITHIIYHFELENDVFIDEHIISEHELNHTLRGRQPIFQTALNDGISL